MHLMSKIVGLTVSILLYNVLKCTCFKLFTIEGTSEKGMQIYYNSFIR